MAEHDDDAGRGWFEIFPVGEGFDFHYRYANGKIAGHNYDSEQLAAQGISDMLDSIAQGIEITAETRLIRKENDDE